MRGCGGFGDGEVVPRGGCGWPHVDASAVLSVLVAACFDKTTSVLRIQKRAFGFGVSRCNINPTLTIIRHYQHGLRSFSLCFGRFIHCCNGCAEWTAIHLSLLPSGIQTCRTPQAPPPATYAPLKSVAGGPKLMVSDFLQILGRRSTNVRAEWHFHGGEKGTTCLDTIRTDT